MKKSCLNCQPRPPAHIQWGYLSLNILGVFIFAGSVFAFAYMKGWL